MRAPTIPSAADQAAPVVDLDTRLVLVGADMDGRLALAGVTFDVETAHIPIPDVEIGPAILTADRPLAELLARAARRLAAAGWSRHTAIDGRGGICPLYAIRLEASSETEEGQARTLLLEAIRTEQPNTPGVPQWNARQTGPAAAIRMLNTAARTAHTQGL